MITWQTDSTGLGAHYTDGDGVTHGMMLSAIPSTDTILPYIAPEPTPQELIAALLVTIQEYIDSKAQAKGYDNANSCISYLTSSNPTWAADATSMRNWRDAVWGFCYANQSSADPSITWDKLLPLLPAAPW